MEAIYEALLLLPDSPSKATKVLNNLAHQHPRFLELIKDMALQLRERFRPHNEQTQAEYQQRCKQILVVFNRYVMLAFKERDNNIYLHIQELYQWVLQILACQTIPLIHKKVLEPAFKEIISSMAFKNDLFLQFLDHVTAEHIDSAAAVFVYLKTLLDSEVYPTEKISSIEKSYKTLFYIGLRGLSQMVEYYLNCYMQDDRQTGQNNTNFTNILKENEYVLDTICCFISFLYNLTLKEKYKHNRDELIGNILLDCDLALYLSRVLKIEHQLFNHGQQEQNKFQLRIIIASNLNSQQKKIINNIKCMCLSTLKLILSLTDKSIPLAHTDKILLKELPPFSELIIHQLIICSYQNVIPTLGEELSIIRIVSSLFDVLSEIIQFTDMQPVFQKLNIEQIIRLTLAFMRTYAEEEDIFRDEVQDYFVMVYYILFGRVEDAEQDESIDISLGEFCMKKNVAKLINCMSAALQGFNSILVEICCDTILLHCELKRSNSQQLKEMFLAKHKLEYSVLQCLSLQSAIFTLTVALDRYSSNLDAKQKIRFLLQTIDLSRLSELQLCRVFVCLSVHSQFFLDSDIYLKYYNYIEKVFSLNKQLNSISKHAYHFLFRLVKAHKKYYENKHYCIFIDKIVNEILQHLKGATAVYIFDFVIQVIRLNQIQECILSLDWINQCLEILNSCICQEFGRKNIQHEILTSIYIIYDQLLQLGRRIVDKHSHCQYQSFSKEVNQFQTLLNDSLMDSSFIAFRDIIQSKDLINQEYHLVYKFGDYLFNLITSDILLSERSVQLVTAHTIHMLGRQEQESLDFENISFKLLYQVINRNPYALKEEHYKIILHWMKEDIEKESLNQIYLNKVCIILQLFYYFISSNVFNGNQMTVFFQPITDAVQKKFLAYLLDANEYFDLIQKQSDPHIKKINLQNIHHTPSKKNSITVIRLYNTILMNPNFKPQSLHLIKDIIKFHLQTNLPAYDLSAHFLALTFVINRSKNSGMVEAFRIGLELLYYNALHPQPVVQQDKPQKQIRNLTKDLKSPISALDPYQQLYNLVNQQINKSKESVILLDYSQSLQELEVDVIEFIKSDQYTLELVKKLSSIRRVNDQPRVIRRIKRSDS